MNEILVSMDLAGTTQNIIKIGLLLGYHLKSPINIIVTGNGSNSSNLEDLNDMEKLNDITESIQNEAQVLKLGEPVFNNINYYQVPNCGIQKKLKLMRDFINDHNISYFISSIKNNNPLPFNHDTNLNEVKTFDKILHDLSCPTMLVNNKISSLNINDIGIFFSKLENVDNSKYSNLKVLANIFNAKMHLMAIVKPESRDNSKIISLLKRIADKYELKNYSLNTVINSNIVEGINFFSQKRILDMIVVSRNDSDLLFEKENLNELINEDICPVFCYWP